MQFTCYSKQNKLAKVAQQKIREQQGGEKQQHNLRTEHYTMSIGLLVYWLVGWLAINISQLLVLFVKLEVIEVNFDRIRLNVEIGFVMRV